MPAYMQTDVGLIPSEWDVKEFRQIGHLSKGRGLLKEDIETSGAVPAIPYTALYTDFSEVVDYGSIKWFVDDVAGTIVVDEPCVLIASSSNMAANTGKASALPGTMSVAIGREVIIFRTDHSAVFLSYLLSTAPYRKRTLVLARGTTIKHLYPATFANYRVALPPHVEQLRISEALSDVDALLAGLDRLIAKKRDLKQAAMQQLLTGQTRLPGFQGEWDRVCAGDIGHFRGGNGFPNRLQGDVDGDYPFYKVSDMNIEGNGTFMSDANNWISETTRKSLGATAFPADSIIFAKVGAAVFLERKKILTRPSCVDNNLAALVLDKSRAVVRFVHYALMHIKFGALVSTTALPSLNGKVLAQIALAIPTLEEQTAIATVLFDMDAELTALEARRDKTRALKQGMMQELLTGRTRLV